MAPLSPSSSYACPYAQIIDSGSSDSESEYPSSSPANAVRMAREHCPAFLDGKCPFATFKADSSKNNVPGNRPLNKSILDVMRRVPLSHVTACTQSVDSTISNSLPRRTSETSAGFRAILTHVHTVAHEVSHESTTSSVPKDVFRLDGSCPFQNFVGDAAFVDVMDGMSLSAIIGRLSSRTFKGSSPSASPIFSPSNSPGTLSHPISTINAGSTSKLSIALKNGTAVAHQMAEDVHFVKNFIKGQICRDSFTELTINLLFVYRALESALDSHHTTLGKLWQPEKLRRSDALLDDVEFWIDSRTSVEDLAPSPATADYVNRLQDVAARDPLLLISHAYTRYMGDLSGGKVLARVARRALGLAKDMEGLKFYEFENITEGAKLFKETYRDYLDSMNFNDATLHRLVSEANIAFVLNMRIFQEIDVKAGIPGSNVIPLEEAFAFGDKIIDITENNKDGDKCPFGFTNPDKKVTKVKKLSVVLDDEKKNRDGRCPWPFVVFHDPFTFIMDYQTW
eukprot:CAMPEP_0113299094 /NCGR_PEP_ID=MMETSP0010_2-20120614/1266_1 /TAXON_ID=216773 ORGANISM="Corethron hystrix, Strain 308" /NCGR_SAMPLE_ID=MMETSP0010_2 /ASSEMBLY_ACC=CAM_ASM_000155 /LENGTH=509 /DNA_ID=CAMNT_0000152259 /DNA_START=26 /DNA_END=1552 /DNA_ORIENTATION=- /assembly_acc=CAM_ASM_000155